MSVTEAMTLEIEAKNRHEKAPGVPGAFELGP